MAVKVGKKYPRNYFRVPQLFFNVPQLFLTPPQLFPEPPQLFAGSNRSSVSAGSDNTGPSTPGPKQVLAASKFKYRGRQQDIN